MVAIVPQMVTISPVNRAKFSKARRRTSHKAAAYTVTLIPTARAVTWSVFPYTSCAANPAAQPAAATDKTTTSTSR